MMLNFLQQNAEWICAIALVFFAGMQWWISYAQHKQELRFRRFDLAKQMDNACIIYKFDKESIHNVVDWFNRNQSNFIYLLNDEDLLKFDQILNFLQSIYGKNKSFNEVIEIYRKHLVELDVVLMNATYGLQKRKKLKQKKELKNA